MQVKDVMTRGAEVIRPDTTVQEAAERMKDLDVGPLPVCQDDRLVGGEGNDHLYGDAGNDTLGGGNGNDGRQHDMTAGSGTTMTERRAHFATGLPRQSQSSLPPASRKRSRSCKVRSA